MLDAGHWQPELAANLPNHQWLKSKGWVFDRLSARAGHWQPKLAIGRVLLGANMDGEAALRPMGKPMLAGEARGRFGGLLMASSLALLSP